MNDTNKTPVRLVILESPYAGDVTTNEVYARDCMRDSLLRGEAPYASHLLYTQPGVLDDNVQDERALGISAGFAWRGVAQATIVYTDLGISHGMELGIADAKNRGVPVEFRQLAAWTPMRGPGCPMCSEKSS